MQRTAATAARRAGFTLIELLAVIMIIGILAGFLLPRIPEAIDQAKVTSCQKNLGEIYKGLMLHDQKFDDLPQNGGVRFFSDLVSRKVLDDTKSVSKKLTCPGVKTSALATIQGVPPEEWYSDPELVDGQSSAYAGRDVEEYPLRRFPGRGDEPLVADDNDGGMNHRTTTNVLYADGSVGTYELALLEEEGILEPDEELIVGPESQVEELRKLSLD